MVEAMEAVATEVATEVVVKAEETEVVVMAEETEAGAKGVAMEEERMVAGWGAEEMEEETEAAETVRATAEEVRGRWRRRRGARRR